MLESLSIENFAIIDRVSIDFSSGMTVLSGETGAGKSIIIDALGILCGGRGSTEFIRTGEQRLLVEGLFTFNTVPEGLLIAFQQFGLDVDQESALTEGLIIRREIHASGKNLIRINGQLANVTLLKDIGSYLVDIHGQNEHQALLDNQQHLNLLDQYATKKLEPVKKRYQTAYETYRELRQAWLKAQRTETEQAQRVSFLEFQIAEIEEAELVLAEDEQLEKLSIKLQGAQKIASNIASINQLFSDSDTSLLTQTDQIMRLLIEIQSYDEIYPELLKRLKSTYYDLQEIAHQVAASELNLETDDQSIDEIESRLSQLGQLKRKYNMSIEEILIYFDEISEEVYQIKHREQYLDDLAKRLVLAYEKAKALADQLHAIRQENATALIGQIEAELVDLYMENSRFDVQFKQKMKDNAFVDINEQLINQQTIVSLDETGYDQVEFFVATNVGESLKPLVKVASGGELSRFMLALKAVFGQAELAKVMVFDEIDTGVSGRVAQAIAEKIHQISLRHQVLCITHLAQVAAIAENQLYISKAVTGERTSTRVESLNLDDRSEVIAQMMSGKVLTQTSLQLAKELLQDYQSNR